MDTPYYEQLQYVGDTRIQALISYTVAGDDRLGRQAIAAFDDSRIPEGITRSRYPAPCRKTSPPSPCSGSACFTTTGCTGPIPHFVRDHLAGHTRRSRMVRTLRSSRRPPPHSFPGGASLTGFPPAKFPPTTPMANPASRRFNISARSPKPPISSATSATRFSRALPVRAEHVRAGLTSNAGDPRGAPRRQSRSEDIQPASQHPWRSL